jgi:hypothetical protein
MKDPVRVARILRVTLNNGHEKTADEPTVILQPFSWLPKTLRGRAMVDRVEMITGLPLPLELDEESVELLTPEQIRLAEIVWDWLSISTVDGNRQFVDVHSNRALIRTAFILGDTPEGRTVFSELERRLAQEYPFDKALAA